MMSAEHSSLPSSRPKLEPSEPRPSAPGEALAEAPAEDDGFVIRVAEPRDRANAPPPKSIPSKKPRRLARVREREEEAVAAIAATRDRAMIAMRNVAAEVRAHPARTLGAAVALGFLLGAALATRVGRVALAAAGRLAMKRLVSG